MNRQFRGHISELENLVCALLDIHPVDDNTHLGLPPTEWGDTKIQCRDCVDDQRRDEILGRLNELFVENEDAEAEDVFVNESIERLIVDTAHFCCDNPNGLDIEEALRDLVSKAIADAEADDEKDKSG